MSTTLQRCAWLGSVLVLASGCPKPQPQLTFLAISPDNARIALGATQQFVANGIFSDGSAKVMTDQVEWFVDDALVADVNAQTPGLVTGLGSGITNIRARLSGVSAVRSFTVTTATIRVLQLYPPRPVAPIGLTIHLQVIAVHTDNTVENVTDRAIWTSANPELFTVKQGLLVGKTAGLGQLSVSYQGALTQVPISVTSATVQRLDVDPSRIALPMGVNQKVAAIATLSDATSLDLTESADWSSSAPTIAFTTNSGTEKGTVVARAKGTAELRANVNGIVGTGQVTVTDASLTSLEIAPATVTIANGTSVDLAATAFFSDGSMRPVTAQSTWSLESSEHAMLELDFPYRVHGTSVGQAIVHAAFGTKTATATVTISSATLSSIEISPTAPTMARGTSQTLHATGIFSDGSTQDLSSQATWVAADDSTIAVSNVMGSRGSITALQEGSTQVSAQVGSVVGQTKVIVTAAALTGLQVTPAAPSLPQGTSTRLIATGLFSDGSTQDVSAQASWASSDTAVANVSNVVATRGLTQALAKGTAQIAATYSGFSASTTLTVTNAVLVSLSIAPSQVSLARGTSAALSVVGIYSDNTTQVMTASVTWSSSNASIADVSNAAGHQGETQALGVGLATIRAVSGSVFTTAQVTVTQAQLVSIEVSPARATIVAGLSQAYTATGTWTDHSTQDVTTQVTWGSSAQAVASISNGAGSKGVLSALSAGTSTVAASLSGITGSTLVTVSPALLQSLSISPPALSVTRGTVTNLHVMGTYTDGSSIDLTTVVTWSTSDAAVMTVSNANGSEGVANASGVGQALITARSGTVSSAMTATVTPALLVGLELTPVVPQVPLGTDVSFTLTGRYSDSTTQDLTAQASWTSTNAAVATVSNGAGTQGKAHAVSQGVATIGAAFGAFAASTTLTVTAATLASISVTPTSLLLAPGTMARLTATGTWTDGSTHDVTTQVTWSSGDDTIAQLSNTAPTEGRVLAIAGGTTSALATLAGVTGSSTVSVSSATLLSIAVTPSNASAPAGLTLQMQATGLFSDATTQDLTEQASWASSDSSRAAVSNGFGSHGLVTALLVGTTNLTATVLSLSSPAVVFTVTSAQLTAIDLTPATASVPRGLTQGFTASGTFTDGSTADITDLVNFTSSNPAVASVSNASGSHGLASGLSVGSSTIAASLSGHTGTATLTVTQAQLVSLAVTPVNVARPLGIAAQFSATGTYTDGTTQDVTDQVTWASSQPGIATISNAATTHGLASPAGVGATSISATLGSASDSTTLTVTPAQLVSIGLTPVNPTIPLGLTQQLVATGVYTDGSTQNLTALATWASTDSSIANVSNASGSQGLASALLQGSVTASATYLGLTGSTTVTVSAAVLQQIQVTPHTPSVPAGLTLQLTATGVYSDSSTQNLTNSVSWSSGDSAVVSVSNNAHGLASAIAPGATSVTATQSGISGSTTFTVTPAVLQSLQVTPPNASRPRGVPQSFTATGLFSNGTTQDLTSAVTWASTDTSIVSISNATGSAGLASTLNVGGVTVSATLGSISDSTPFTVTAAVLTGVTISPANSTVPLGSVRALTATGTYTDGSTQNLTSQGSWSSSDVNIVSVSNAAGSEGLASTIAIGSVTITMSVSTFVVTTSMTVSQASLASIDLTPSGGSTALGFTRQFIAIGTYTDGTTQVLTTLVTWASSDTTKAFISNSASSRGLMSTVAVGTITISATYAGLTGTTSHTVSPAMLVGLTVTPASVTFAPSATRQLTATGSFSDGSSQDLTQTVTWSSNATGVVQVSNALGSHGLATAIAPGTAKVTATSGAQSGFANLTVQ